MANEKIKKVLVIGSGPIVIGQGSEHDYCTARACLALKENGIKVVLVNSNPTSMTTDRKYADSIYIEPLSIDVIKRIIEKEKPDSILATVGGVTGLELCLSLSLNGYLEDNGIALLGIDPEVIHTIQDRQAFKSCLSEIGEPTVASKVVSTVDGAAEFAQKVGYPVIVRPAYTLGGDKEEFCYSEWELREIAKSGLEVSKIHEILVEKCISGWKELEYEVVRDEAGNCINVCSLENVDPVGIHAGDSIVVAPAQTLDSFESAKLRASALNIINSLGIKGSCSVKFAVKADGSEYAVLGVDATLGRSCALVSKITGYPVARVSTLIALGYKLDEIKNEVVGSTTACNEPNIDYCAVRFPKWSFGNFAEIDRQLDTSMKATGETLSIGTSFELAFMKAIRSIDIGADTPLLPKHADMSLDELYDVIAKSNDERIFAVYAAIKKGADFEKLYELTKIDYWFMAKLKNIADAETELEQSKDGQVISNAKAMGFPYSAIWRLSNPAVKNQKYSGFKTIDTCAAEFDAQNPYFYSSFDEENEAAEYIEKSADSREKVLVVGSGAVCVGNGAELDYCAAHCVDAIKSMNKLAVVANNNPEAITTDYKVADRLYIDPVTSEDLFNIINTEKPDTAVLQFGGKNAIQLSTALKLRGVNVVGASNSKLEILTHNNRINTVLDEIGVPHPAYERVSSLAQAEEFASLHGFPITISNDDVSVIAYNFSDIKANYSAVELGAFKGVKLKRYYIGTSLEADVISDGDNVLIPAVTEHIEKSGVNSVDSISVYPTITVEEKFKQQAVEYATSIAKVLEIKGIINIQFTVYDNKLYFVKASLTNETNIPFISKVTSLPVVEIATRCMFGEKLENMNYGTGLYKQADLYGVRVPVFSFENLRGLDTQLGLDAKSTGEVLGIAHTFEDALLKGLLASNMRIKRKGGVLITVRDYDKNDVIDIADKFSQLGFDIYATAGTAKKLNSNCVATNSVRKIHEGSPNTIDLLKSGKIVYVISTSGDDAHPLVDDIKIRRKAVEMRIPCFTSTDTAKTFVRCLEQKKLIDDIEIINITEE